MFIQGIVTSKGDHMDDEKDVKVYRLKIVYKDDEILHLSESIDGEGTMSLNIDGELIAVPEEMAKMLDDLDTGELGLS
jgi:hypothetical protein